MDSCDYERNWSRGKLHKALEQFASVSPRVVQPEERSSSSSSYMLL